MKIPVYHLIILDESGSMCDMTKATISGCNETLNSIRSMQEEFNETQEHFVSIYLFQSNTRMPSRYIVMNEAIGSVKNITEADYKPWGGTPLNDAIGTTLTDIMSITKNKDITAGTVTIITDGYENSSEHYTREHVSRMILQMKEMGWSFSFIGADIDARRVARSMHIDNSLQFDKTEAGMSEMFCHERRSRGRWAKNIDVMAREHCCCNINPGELSEEARESMVDAMKVADKDYFEED